MGREMLHSRQLRISAHNIHRFVGRGLNRYIWILYRWLSRGIKGRSHGVLLSILEMLCLLLLLLSLLSLLELLLLVEDDVVILARHRADFGAHYPLVGISGLSHSIGIIGYLAGLQWNGVIIFAWDSSSLALHLRTLLYLAWVRSACSLNNISYIVI